VTFKGSAKATEGGPTVKEKGRKLKEKKRIEGEVGKAD